MDPGAPDPPSTSKRGFYGRAVAPDFGYEAPPVDSLQLQQVHYIVRHGERTPVRSRLQNAKPPLPQRWNLCKEGNAFRAAVLAGTDGAPVSQTTRAVELVDAKGKGLEVQDGDCLYGELTDIGRRSTFDVGQRIRRLYMDRLGLIPQPGQLSEKDSERFYFRSTNMPRTVESLQQIVAGMLSPVDTEARAAPIATGLAATSSPFSPKLLVRDGSVEDLLPNTYACSAFRTLDQFFAAAAARRWNPYLAQHDSKIKQHTDGKAIRVDSHPRLNGILDTVNAAVAHDVPIPDTFRDPKLWRDLERAVVTEWFAGYFAPEEVVRAKYRRLGMGRFLNNVADHFEAKARDVASSATAKGKGEQEPLRLGVYAAHDTSLAGILCTLDAFQDRWPAFTASLGFELFSDAKNTRQSGIFARLGQMVGLTSPPRPPHYVRLRFGDETIRVPACAAKGNHLVNPVTGESHPDFCTLDAFLSVTRALKHPDGLTWQQECNLDQKHTSTK